MATVLIIGPGAIGIGLAEQAGCRDLAVVFAGRPSRPLEPRVVHLKTPEGRRCVTIKPVQRQNLADIKLIIIAVKSHQLQGALRDVLGGHVNALSARIPIVSVCNGAVQSEIQKAATLWPQFLWRLGISTFGVTEVKPDYYEIRSTNGKMHWGAFIPDQEPPTTIERQLATAPRCVFEKAIQPLVQRKWLFNTVLNSLAAAYRLPRNVDILAHGQEMQAVFAEALALGAQYFGPWTESDGELFQALKQLIEDTSENENSMAKDRRLHLPTETQYLAGLAECDPSRYPLLMRLHNLLSSPIS